MGRLVPVKYTSVEGIRFYFLRQGSPPQFPEVLSKQGVEFHEKVASVSGETAIDVGANIGSYTLRLARRFSLVFAFEPNPLVSRVLRTNVGANKFTNIRVYEVALSDKSGFLPFYLDSRGEGHSSLNPHHYDAKYDVVKQVSVMKLDEFLNDVGRVDFVKVDAEGFELQILKGARRLIDRFRPILAIEVHCLRVPKLNHSCSCDTCSLLVGSDYDVEVIGESRSMGPVHWTWARPVFPRSL